MKTSIVVTSKNDNYGGYLNLRAAYALNQMLKVFDEVVYVDWCSDDDNSLIHDVNLDKTGRLKHIQVTKKDVANINPDLLEIPIVEVLGRNIGVRRSSGDWIVSSNIDILPDKPNVSTLNKDMMYAAQRRNVPLDVTLNAPENFFNFLQENRNMFVQAQRIYDTHAGRYDPWSLTVCCGDFQLAHKDLWHKMKGFEETLLYRDCGDSNVLKKATIYGSGADLIYLDVFHLDHDGHFLNVDGVSKKNDWDESVGNFESTTNPDTWGFSDYQFHEETL